jgi:hypothetical protein
MLEQWKAGGFKTNRRAPRPPPRDFRSVAPYGAEPVLSSHTPRSETLWFGHPHRRYQRTHCKWAPAVVKPPGEGVNALLAWSLQTFN